MRIAWTLAASIACCSASPAAADITARYVLSGEIGEAAMIIQVNDRGDSRIGGGSQEGVLTIDGHTYFLEADHIGPYVVRMEDAMAVSAEQLRAIFGDEAASPPIAPGETWEAVEQGTETVAGRTGTKWTLRLRGQGRPKEPPLAFDFVISSDPELAPIGRAFARQDGGTRRQDAAGQGSLTAPMRALLKRGTAIRMGRSLRLESVDSVPIAASVFVLPSAPLTRAQYGARVGLSVPPAD